MSCRVCFFIVLAVVASMAFPFLSGAENVQKIALVIGNGAYQSAPLDNPSNDARDMADTLKKLGFEVIHVENASQRTMISAIRNFSKKLTKGGVGLFYFAGHGMQVNGHNYLIPVDAVIEAQSEIEFEAVDAGRILAGMEDAGNDTNIIILDSCRDNPFSRSFRSFTRGLAKMDAPKGSFIAYATAPGDMAADGTGRNGIFTGSLLRHMTAPGLKIEEVLKRTRVEVARQTGDKQIPWQSSSLMGDFYFAPASGAQPAAATNPVALINPAVSREKIVREDRHYVEYETGVVRDMRNDLEWYAGPKKMDWRQAQAWAQNLNAAGGGWRMPSRKELRTLYEEGVGNWNMTPLLETINWVWSREKKGSSEAWGVNFFGGNEIYNSLSYPTRVFAVRSR